MLNYKESLGFGYFVGSGAILTASGSTTADLAPLQIGLFNSKNYTALAAGTSSQVVPEIIVAMGSPNEEKISWTNAASSIKSVPIRASKLISYRKATPKTALNHKVAIGFDGVSDCKTITALCDQTYSLHIQVEGSPTTRFFGAKPLTQTYVYNTGCCTDCTSGCSADVEKMVDTFVKQINSDPRISPFVLAEKLVAYGGEPTGDTSCTFDVYTVTIPDEGGVADLAAIKVAYPGTTVTRISRVGIYSTYQLVTDGAAPAPYVTDPTTIIANCTDCPSGYVFVPAYDRIKVQIADEGLDISTTLSALTNVVSATKIVGDASTGTYILIADGTVTIAAASGAVVAPAGTTEPYCLLSGGTACHSYPFTQTGTLCKGIRTLCLVLGDLPCGDAGTELSALTDFYANNPDVVDGSLVLTDNGACANTFTIQQYSKNLVDPTTCTTGIFQYDELAPYGANTWGDCCVSAATNVITNIGIVLTGAYVDTKFSRCSFKYDDFVELDLPRIYVRQGDFVELENKCNEPWPVTLLQTPQYPTGLGEFVLRDYIEVMQFKGQRWSDDPRWREVYGYNYDFIKTNKQYKQFYLEFEALDKYNVNTPYGNDMKTTIVFAFEQGVDTTAFENLLEGWIASARPDLIDADPHDNLRR